MTTNRRVSFALSHPIGRIREGNNPPALSPHHLLQRSQRLNLQSAQPLTPPQQIAGEKSGLCPAPYVRKFTERVYLIFLTASVRYIPFADFRTRPPSRLPTLRPGTPGKRIGVRIPAAGRWGRALLIPLFVTTTALAQTEVEETLCPRQAPDPALSIPALHEPLPPGWTELTADTVEGRLNLEYRLKGNVLVRQDRQWVTADFARYLPATQTVITRGRIRLGNETLVAEGRDGIFHLGTRQGRLAEPQFRLMTKKARGDAATVVFENAYRTRLRRARYTTCPFGKDDWWLKSPAVILDQQSGFGTAIAASLEFKNIPILFLPYITFPLNDQRKTGFLVPSFGRSSLNGTEITVPYYFNLAPNYDATLTARNMSRRGVQWLGEFRYLFGSHEGRVEIENLFNDHLSRDENGRPDFATRRYLALNHTSQVTPNLTARLNLSYISDPNYFTEISNKLNSRRVNYQPQTFNLKHVSGQTLTQVNLTAYQSVADDPSRLSKPHSILPRITLSSSATIPGAPLRFSFSGEWIRFHHPVILSGNRVDLAPAVEAGLRQQAGFFVPKITLRHTRYNLYNVRDDRDALQTRTLPVTSVDMGIFLERDTVLFQQELLQTLEPRLFYVYIPFRDQNDIPLFDSGQPTFSFSQIFRENRFNGTDRIGDTNQAAASLSTRFLNADTGEEYFNASIGQLFYFSPRRVNLSGDRIDRTSRSALFFQAGGQPHPTLRLSADFQYSDEENEVQKGAFHLQYRRSNRKIVNARYRYTQGEIIQSDFSLIWPIHRRWNLIGRRLYSNLGHQLQESLYGFEYNSCCWTFRWVVHRVFIPATDPEDEKINRSAMAQIELRGLAGIGNPVHAMMSQSVPGFQSSNYTLGIQ